MDGTRASFPLSPVDAERLVAEATPDLGSEHVALSGARGRILREDIVADRPFPSFDRVTLDGYALRSSEAAAGGCGFRVAGFQPAGRAPMSLPAQAGHCIEVGTGAILPVEADCVVPYESVERAGDRIILRGGVIPRPGDAVHARGSDRIAGSVLLRSGVRLGGRELAVAAACGRVSVLVASGVRIGLLVTGDELVEPGCPVLPWQQRRSNDLALCAALEAAGAEVSVRHARDDTAQLGAALSGLLEGCDFLVTTGGISRGRLDLLPELFERAGAQRIFHGITQRPGKPLWFGTARGKPIFGLPGNPVSSYTCLHRFVLPALGHAAGATAAAPEFVSLAEPAASDRRLTLYVPAVLVTSGRSARLAPFNTSGDLAALLETDGFVEIPPGGEGVSAGFLAPFRRWV